MALTCIYLFAGLCDACRLEKNHRLTSPQSFTLSGWPLSASFTTMTKISQPHLSNTYSSTWKFQTLQQQLRILRQTQSSSACIFYLVKYFAQSSPTPINIQTSSTPTSIQPLPLPFTPSTGYDEVFPGAFVSQRYMLLPISCITNWEIIRLKKQQRAHHKNFLENLRRCPFTYKPNMEVMLQDPTDEKLSAKCKGHFKIIKVHSNGTVTICLKTTFFNE